MEGVAITVGTMTGMEAETFVMPVDIVKNSPSGYRSSDAMVVIVKKIDGAYNIFKCVDIYPEA